MNLAARDIRHNFGRFALTAFGIGLLLMLVLGMGGIYQGLIFEATQLVDDIDADFWVVQKGTRGPFAEVSRIPADLEFRLLGVPGVKSARSFVSHTIQRKHQGKRFRMFVQGLGWPDDKGEWVRLVAGRPLAQAHYEMTADKILGFELGERIPLRKDVYTVVGLTQGMASSSGDGMAFLTVRDALTVQFDVVGESTRLDRAARRSRAADQDFGRAQPELLYYLGVADRSNHLPDALSGGQQERVAVARALANEPNLVLADEPTAALDCKRGRQVMELFRKVAHERRAGVIVVTHDQRARDVFDRTLEMEDGQLRSAHSIASTQSGILEPG